MFECHGQVLSNRKITVVVGQSGEQDYRVPYTGPHSDKAVACRDPHAVAVDRLTLAPSRYMTGAIYCCPVHDCDWLLRNLGQSFESVAVKNTKRNGAGQMLLGWPWAGHIELYNSNTVNNGHSSAQ